MEETPKKDPSAEALAAAAKVLEEERTERAKLCFEEVNAVLKKYNCVINANTMLTAR